ncbi:MAG: acyl-CoA dehydrogenase family protein [Chloroflexota bacterium]|nr:acyl-CoA dehydrogenase family protein [Chloroflexota bacterium]
MAENLFTDNLDLQFQLDHLDLSEVVESLEDGYSAHAQYPAAPRNYADAKDNYRLLLNLLGEICATRIAPRAAEADEEGAHFCDGRVTYAAATQEALEVLCQADLMGAVLSWEYGGLNLPETIFQMMVEIISRADAGLMTIFGMQALSAAIAEYGDEEMKSRVLPRFARGEVTGAMVLTEPDAGSDLGVVQTRATYDETAGVWRLNGVKRFITNGCAEILLVLARSEEGSADARGLSMFLVEADESVRIRRIENKLGIHSSPTCEVQFNDTPAQLLGKRRFGLIRYAMGMMNGARLAVAAQALGIAEAAYREAYRYAEKRIQFGQPINSMPAVYRMLLSMRGEIEATRALVYEVARWVDIEKVYEHGKNLNPSPAGRKRLKQINRLTAVLTPLVKYYATEMGNRVCYQAMQIHGGTGYMREFNVERHYRDVRVTNIYEGTSQLQVVAAIGGLLGRSLDNLLDEWADLDYGVELALLKSQVEEATVLFNRCIDHLKEQEDRAVIDYYAVDLTEIAAYVVNCWLVLRDARLAARKRKVARVYVAETLPKIRGKVAALQAIDPALLRDRDVILAV